MSQTQKTPRQRVYHKLMEIAKQTGGQIRLGDADVQAVMTGPNGDSTMYRMPTQIWAIRTKAGLEVKAIRQGRKIIAYEIPALAVTPSPAAPAAESDDLPETE